MPIRIQLEGDTSLMVDVDLDAWNKAFKRALRSGGMLEIEADDGRILAINPHQVLYLEEIPDGADPPDPAEAPAPAPEVVAG
jgi:hypothetical protein